MARSTLTIEQVLEDAGVTAKELLQIVSRAFTIERGLEDAGLTAKWEAKGEARGETRATERDREQFRQKMLEGARKMKHLGASSDIISAGLGLSPQEIEAL
jgi:hypothetical protein